MAERWKNLETTFDGLVARTLGGGGFVLVAIIATLLLVSLRRQPAMPVSLRKRWQDLVVNVGA